MLLLLAKKIDRLCDSSMAKASMLPLLRIPSALCGQKSIIIIISQKRTEFTGVLL